MRPLSKVSLSRVRRLLPFISGFRSKLAIIFLLSFSNTVAGLLGPIFTKILIDDVLLARNLRLLWILTGIMIAVTLLSYVLGGFNRYYYTSVTARVLFNLRQHLFEHLDGLAQSDRLLIGKHGKRDSEEQERFHREDLNLFVAQCFSRIQARSPIGRQDAKY